MIYVHVPFCKRFCHYCGFYSTVNPARHQAYLEALWSEWTLRKAAWLPLLAQPSSPGTLYLGGGTPSVYPAQALGNLISRFAQDLHEAGLPLGEVTVEINPQDISLAYCQTLLKSGVNRLSMGIQSFDDSCLKRLGRRHNAQEALSAFQAARQAGFDNISIDLMFGYPSLSNDIWKDTIERAIALQPDHISAYQLSLEPTSRWGRLYKKGLLDLPNDVQCARQYNLLRHILRKGGYKHYEISNFCLPDKASQHNSGYWKRVPYLGLGPSAHSFDGKNRSWNRACVKTYIEDIAAKDIRPTYDKLSAKEIFEEQVMLGLRTVEGIDLTSLTRKDAARLLAKTESLVATGRMVRHKERLRIAAPYLFIADWIMTQVL